MEDKAIALRVLIAASKAQPDQAAALWQAARILLNSPAQVQKAMVGIPTTADQENNDNNDKLADKPEYKPLRAEFDYADENGLFTHRTIYLLAMTDGRDIKRNAHLPVADRYGYLLTGYCTLRNRVRSFRASRISNLRTFIEGEPRQPNRQWRQPQQIAG